MPMLNSQNASSHQNVLGSCHDTREAALPYDLSSHQKVSINLGHILIISWTHVKKAQDWVLVLGPGVDGVCSDATMLGDIHHSVMPCDAAFSLAICVSVRAAIQALHESFCTVLRSGFLHKQILVLQPNFGVKVCSTQTADVCEREVHNELEAPQSWEGHCSWKNMPSNLTFCIQVCDCAGHGHKLRFCMLIKHHNRSVHAQSDHWHCKEPIPELNRAA